jgi:DNA-binding transcriptional MerR regulator
MDRTLAEFVKAVAENKQSVNRVTRLVRYWTEIGALVPSGPTHSGTGRHRRYPKSAGYYAVLLLRLADWGLSVSVLKAVGKQLPQSVEASPSRALWSDAIDGSRDVWILLLIRRIAPDEGHGLPQSDGERDQHLVEMHLTTGTEIAGPVTAGDGGVVVCLTKLFLGRNA